MNIVNGVSCNPANTSVTFLERVYGQMRTKIAGYRANTRMRLARPHYLGVIKGRSPVKQC